MQGRFVSPGPERTRSARTQKFGYLLVLALMLVASSSIVVALQSRTTPAQAASTPPEMGVNLAWSGDSNGDLLFADTFKTYRLFAPPGQSNPPAVDANGWPNGDFSAYMWDGSFLKHTTGTYALRFQGKASISISLVRGEVQNQSYDQASNTTTAQIVIQEESTLVLNFTNTQKTASSANNTGIANIQMMRPVSDGSTSSYSFSTTFTDAIKNFLTRFKVVRFMDTTGANASQESTWASRRLPQSSQQSIASWEYVIQLCNETGKDPYINVPALATDDYILQLASLFRYGSDANGTVYTSTQSNPVHAPLNANLHVYIEYSNEVWNGAFLQMHQNHDAAVNEVNAGNSPLNYDNDTNEWAWTWRRVAKRIHDISETFRSQFGDGAMPPNSNPRIRPVLEWQYGNMQDTASIELSFLHKYYNNGDGQQHVANPHPVNYFIYGAGGAAYSGPNNSNASSIDAIYASGLDTEGPGIGTIDEDIAFVDQYGLKHVAYEGGFQIGGDGANDLQKQANRDPRAKDMEIQTQTLYTQRGGDLLVYFDSSSFNYGLAIPTVLDTTPKLQAIDELNQTGVATPTPTPSTPTPTPTSTGNGTTLFSSGFESGNPALTWTDSVDTNWPGGGLLNVTGICCGLTAPETGTRSETGHTGSTALMYSGNDTSGSQSYAYQRLFDLSNQNITVGASTKLDYWIYPQDATSSSFVSGNNSSCVALDLIFVDSNGNQSNLRDSGAVDQGGNYAHPSAQCGKLTLNQWNHVTVNLGAHSTGLKIIRIDLGYDQGSNTGGYRGYIDDISIVN